MMPVARNLVLSSAASVDGTVRGSLWRVKALPALFHVKHHRPLGDRALFPDTEIPENHVEDLLNVDAPCDAPETR